MALALLLWGLGEGLFLHIQPLYIRQLGATSVQIGGALAAASIVRAVAFMPSGLLADRLPRKRLILGAWVLGPAAAVLMGLARSWQALVPGLMLYAASAYCIPAINAYLAQASQGQAVERTFTTVYAAHTVGGIVSPTLGGWLAAAAGMRFVYFLAAGLFLLSAAVAVQLSAQPVPRRDGGRARWGALWSRRFAAFAAVVLLILASKARSQHWA
jgi:MFS family permease